MKQYLFLLFVPLFTCSNGYAAPRTTTIEVNKEATIDDTPTSIQGINHVGLSVKDMETALAFYQSATGFELVSRSTIKDDAEANRLFGSDAIEVEIAILKAPNLWFELYEFKANQDTPTNKMPPQGPGMTHTCFQSTKEDSAYDKFIKAGATLISKGETPVDLGGYGVTYAYAHDPEGNMIEMEQLDENVLERAGYTDEMRENGLTLWMTQVGLATSDLNRLMRFYQKVLSIAPYRVTELKDNPRADDIAGVDDLHLLGGWFKMNKKAKVIEIWQYKNPETVMATNKRQPSTLGYSFSLEVGNIKSEYDRLTDLGIEFISEPIEFGPYLQVYARDIDGNIFALRQPIQTDSPYSLRRFDADM